MSTVQITDDNFSDYIEGDAIVLLDFGASWCGPCKSFAPIFDAAAAKHADIVFGTIDTDAQQELAQAFGIRSVPTLVALREKVMVFRESGAMQGSELEKVIAHVRGLDMEAVHAEIRSEENSSAA